MGSVKFGHHAVPIDTTNLVQYKNIRENVSSFVDSDCRRIAS